MLFCYSYCKGICCGCHIEAWHTTVRIELKRTSWGSEVAKKGISCYDASADSCIWNVRGTCCRDKEDCRHACVHGLQDLLYFWKLSRSDRIRLGRLPCMNNSLAQGFSCVQIIFSRLTLKGFYLQMNTVRMRMQIIRHGKFLITLWTRETRSIIQFVVLLPVADQVPFLHIWFSAFWAEMSLDRHCFCGVEVINGWPVVSTSI